MRCLHFGQYTHSHMLRGVVASPNSYLTNRLSVCMCVYVFLGLLAASQMPIVFHILLIFHFHFHLYITSKGHDLQPSRDYVSDINAAFGCDFTWDVIPSGFRLRLHMGRHPVPRQLSYPTPTFARSTRATCIASQSTAGEPSQTLGVTS